MTALARWLQFAIFVVAAITMAKAASFGTPTFWNINDFAPPTVLNVTAQPSNTSQGQQVQISANVTDNTRVDTVIAEITFSNGSTTAIFLFNSTRTIYNNTFTPGLEDPIGVYNVTILANDTSGNINGTETTNFTVLDGKPPAIVNVTATPALVNQTDTVNITANVTDNTNISTVIANITRSDGTSALRNMSLSGGLYRTNFTPSATDPIGIYNVTILANDIRNNLNNTETANFTVLDGIPPSIQNSTAVPSPVNITKPVTISANVTDNTQVGTVVAEITLPNGSVTAIFLTNDTQDKYNSTFTPTELLGVHNVTILANDTSGNVNSSTTNFTVVDQIPPNITILGCSPDPVDFGNNVTCNATIQDFATDSVTAIIQSPTGATFNATVQNVTNNYFFTFTNITEIGEYNITWEANDTSANTATAQDNFTVQEIKPPEVFNLTATPPVVNQTDTVNITANVTDNFNLSTVRANITKSDGTSIIANMTQSGGLFRANFTPTATDPLGTYNITILANDTAGNLNNTERTNFTVTDGILPIITIVSPGTATFVPGTTINVIINVTDNINISTVKANITLPDGNVTALNLTNTTATSFRANFTNTSQLGSYLLQASANDTSNNLNTASRTFTIATPPTPAPRGGGGSAGGWKARPRERLRGDTFTEAWTSVEIPYGHSVIFYQREKEHKLTYFRLTEGTITILVDGTPYKLTEGDQVSIDIHLGPQPDITLRIKEIDAFGATFEGRLYHEPPQRKEESITETPQPAAPEETLEPELEPALPKEAQPTTEPKIRGQGIGYLEIALAALFLFIALWMLKRAVLRPKKSRKHGTLDKDLERMRKLGYCTRVYEMPPASPKPIPEPKIQTPKHKPPKNKIHYIKETKELAAAIKAHILSKYLPRRDTLENKSRILERLGKQDALTAKPEKLRIRPPYRTKIIRPDVEAHKHAVAEDIAKSYKGEKTTVPYKPPKSTTIDRLKEVFK